MGGLEIAGDDAILSGVGTIGTITLPIAGFFVFICFRHFPRRYPHSWGQVFCNVASCLFMNISCVVVNIPSDWTAFASIGAVPTPAIIVGIVLVYLGDLLFLWACAARVGAWGICLSFCGPRPLCTGGPYAYVRHPMYLAWAIYVPGLLLASSDWLFPLSLTVRLYYQLFHLPKEEQALMQAYGAPYEEYRLQTGAFWPRTCHPERKYDRLAETGSSTVEGFETETSSVTHHTNLLYQEGTSEHSPPSYV